MDKVRCTIEGWQLAPDGVLCLGVNELTTGKFEKTGLCMSVPAQNGLVIGSFGCWNEP